MLAVDTNVIVRLLVQDDPGQYQRARDIFGQASLFLTKTVLLEAAWVLRYGYRLQAAEVMTALEALISLPNLHLEAETEVRQAIAWHRDGMDFADALHLAASSRATAFLTFDRDMIKIGRRLGLPVSAP